VRKKARQARAIACIEDPDIIVGILANVRARSNHAPWCASASRWQGRFHDYGRRNKIICVGLPVNRMDDGLREFGYRDIEVHFLALCQITRTHLVAADIDSCSHVGSNGERSVGCRHVDRDVVAAHATHHHLGVHEQLAIFVHNAQAGSTEIRAGNPDAAIKILEDRAQAADKPYVADELATLCALYIAKGQLSAASVTCNDAVENDRSKAAYNNRGVFRTQLGDTSGAMEDFAHARNRPDDQRRYVEELMSGDAQHIASNNYVVAEKYEMNMRNESRPTMVSQTLGASIEDLGNN